MSELLKDLHEIESNDDNIINSLVDLLYKNPSTRKKKLLWFAFGEQLYNNLSENIDKDTEVCMKCGKRVLKGSLIRNKCLKCRDKELKEKGTKTIQCIDCGVEFEVPRMSKKRCRCDDCSKKERQRIHRENVAKNRKNKNVTPI